MAIFEGDDNKCPSADIMDLPNNGKVRVQFEEIIVKVEIQIRVRCRESFEVRPR